MNITSFYFLLPLIHGIRFACWLSIKSTRKTRGITHTEEETRRTFFSSFSLINRTLRQNTTRSFFFWSTDNGNDNDVDDHWWRENQSIWYTTIGSNLCGHRNSRGTIERSSRSVNRPPNQKIIHCPSTNWERERGNRWVAATLWTLWESRGNSLRHRRIATMECSKLRMSPFYAWKRIHQQRTDRRVSSSLLRVLLSLA